MDDLFNPRVAIGDNAEKFDVPPPAEPGLGLPAAAGPDLTPAEKPAAPERALTEAEKLVDPELLAQCQAKVREFSRTAKAWKDIQAIETAEVSGQLTDFIAGARSVFQTVDKYRKEAKKPYDEKSDKVQALFAGILAEITKTVDAVKPMQEAWLAKEKLRLAAEKAAQAKAADEARLKAEADLLAARENDDIAATVQAEADAKEATKLAKAAARPATVKAGSASGATKAMGLRRQIVVETESLFLAFTHFKKHPDLEACLKGLAAAEARSAGVDAIDKGAFTIPGFKLSTKEVL